jgi:hypothetical protein
LPIEPATRHRVAILEKGAAELVEEHLPRALGSPVRQTLSRTYTLGERCRVEVSR